MVKLCRLWWKLVKEPILENLIDLCRISNNVYNENIQKKMDCIILLKKKKNAKKETKKKKKKKKKIKTKMKPE